MRRTIAAIWMLLTLQCNHSTHLVSNEFHDCELTRMERWAVRLHELCCRSCRRFRQQVLFMKKAAGELANRDLSENERMPAELRDRIRAKIQHRLG